MKAAVSIQHVHGAAAVCDRRRASGTSQGEYGVRHQRERHPQRPRESLVEGCAASIDGGSNYRTVLPGPRLVESQFWMGRLAGEYGAGVGRASQRPGVLDYERGKVTASVGGSGYFLDMVGVPSGPEIARRQSTNRANSVGTGRFVSSRSSAGVLVPVERGEVFRPLNLHIFVVVAQDFAERLSQEAASRARSHRYRRTCLGFRLCGVLFLQTVASRSG